MINNDNTINVETKTIEWANEKIAFITILIYITIYHTNQLLYCKGRIQRMSNDNSINMETKTIEWVKWQNFIYYNLNLHVPTIYYTYQLLYCKENIHKKELTSS